MRLKVSLVDERDLKDGEKLQLFRDSEGGWGIGWTICGRDGLMSTKCDSEAQARYWFANFEKMRFGQRVDPEGN